MAYISASKSPLLKPTVFSNLSRLSTTHFKSLRLFSSESSLESLQETPDQQPPIPQTDTQNEESVAVADANPNPNPVLPMGKHRNPDALLMEGKRQNDKEIFDFNRISELRKSLIVEKRLPMGPSERDTRFMYELKRARSRLLNPECPTSVSSFDFQIKDLEAEIAAAEAISLALTDQLQASTSHANNLKALKQKLLRWHVSLSAQKGGEGT